MVARMIIDSHESLMTDTNHYASNDVSHRSTNEHAFIASLRAIGHIEYNGNY